MGRIRPLAFVLGSGCIVVCCCSDSCDGENGQGSDIQVKMRGSEKVQTQ